MLEWGQRLGRPRCPYVRRWMVQTRWGSIRLHHWTGPDDSRASHDHPWWFLTLVLRGAYTDANKAGRDRLTAGSVRFRRAEHRHRVLPDAGGCWTLVLTGPAKEEWGFFINDSYWDAETYSKRFGDPPCSTARHDGPRLGFPR